MLVVLDLREGVWPISGGPFGSRPIPFLLVLFVYECGCSKCVAGYKYRVRAQMPCTSYLVYSEHYFVS